ncbi:MAG TPA: ACT domain-containing protein [Rhodothermales bacterium]|nr:ACT domain-containing protein [Rhodothermales bacterium]
MTNRKLQFEPLPGSYSVCRLPAQVEIPAWVDGEGFVSITRTDDELSLVMREDRVPPDVRAQRDLSGFRIAGSLDFSEVGILRTFSAALADAEIPVFAVSTFDTDYVFVPSSSMPEARRVLTASGHSFQSQ